MSLLGIDQYGNQFRINKHPRKELVEQLGRKHVRKMYVDKKDGGVYHVGYVIGSHWISLYRPYEVKA